MSEAAARIRHPIDLDEFERRLRAGEIGSRLSDDPVAELARLVGHADPFRAPAVAPQLRPAVDRHAAADRRAGSHLQQVHPPAESDGSAHWHAPPATDDDGFGYHTGAVYSDQPHDHGAAPDLRGSLHVDAADAQGQAAPVAASHAYADASFSSDDPAFAEHGAVPAGVLAAQDAPRRSWRGVIILSTILATGFAGLAAALTTKGSFLLAAKSPHTTTSGVPIIMAGGPTKVQPPKSGPDAADDQASILDRTSSVKTTAAKVVNTVEQPVDLSQQKPKRDLPVAAAAPAAPTNAAPPADVAAVREGALPPPPRPLLASLEPSVPSASSVQGASVQSAPSAIAAVPERSSAEDLPAPPVGASGFPTPKRVKVISVRPDGSIIGSEQQPGTSEAAAPKLPDSAPQQEAVAATPVPASAPHRAAPDSVASLIDQARPESAKPALEKPAPDMSAAAPRAETRLATARPKRAKAKSTEVADLNANADRPTEHAAERDGTFAAQLAASPSESAAKATLRKLQKQYGSSFSGHRLSYRRVKVDGKVVYRVRLGSLSKDDADSVCGKLQADGGSCFVAKN